MICWLHTRFVLLDTKLSPSQELEELEGIALVHRADSNIKLDKTKITQDQTWMEHHLCITVPHTPIILQLSTDTSIVQFISDLTDVLEEYVNCHSCHTILGYFNIWINEKKDSDMINCNDFLDTFDFTNKVQFSTNRQPNTINFIIAPNKSNYIKNVKQGELFSHHYMILFDIMEPTSSWKFKTVAYHKTKDLNKEEFSKNLAR